MTDDIKARIASARAALEGFKPVQAWLAREGMAPLENPAALADSLATDCETLMREREELQALLAPARLEGESDADTLRRVLASYRALAAAGEEVPSRSKISELLQRERTIGDMTAAILDLFRPIFARLTQERDEQPARHLWERALSDLADTVNERDALRQRAERAEQEVEAARRRDVQREVEVATACRLRDDANVAAANLRARIADLEAQLAARRVEPGADVVGRLTDIYECEYARSPAGRRTSALRAMHAVLSALAAMGAEAWPTLEELQVVGPTEMHHLTKGQARGVDCIVRAKVAPVLGALRTRVAELEVNLALRQPLNTEGVTVQAVRRCILCGGSGNVQGMPCGNCSGTGYCE
jgi:hypothetical protein